MSNRRPAPMAASGGPQQPRHPPTALRMGSGRGTERFRQFMFFVGGVGIGQITYPPREFCALLRCGVHSTAHIQSNHPNIKFGFRS